MNLQTERLVTFAQGARSFPRLTGDRPVSPSTLFRWSRDGLLAADGRRVRLESRRIGRTFVTSDEAIKRFLDTLNGDVNIEATTPRSPAETNKASRRAAEALDKLGVGVSRS